jgi:hypothetical protein
MEKHPLAGKTVTLKLAADTEGINGKEFRVEDYWQNVAGKSWMDCQGNPACLVYAMRSAFGALPMDNNVVYGKVGPFGHLVHVSELVTDSAA